MKRRMWLAALAGLLMTAAAGIAADDPNMGTWKLDEAKSKITAGTPKNTTVMYEASGDSIKVTIDGVGADGKATHDEWTGKYDGKDYPVTGDASADTRSYKRVNSHTLVASNHKGGKVVLTARIVVSADGKTRTVTVTTTDASGKKVSSTSVYDKQ